MLGGFVPVKILTWESHEAIVSLQILELGKLSCVFIKGSSEVSDLDDSFTPFTYVGEPC